MLFSDNVGSPKTEVSLCFGVSPPFFLTNFEKPSGMPFHLAS
jgi:hypothetical protein